MPVEKPFLRLLRAGDILVYLARPEDLPVSPAQEWRGRVLYVCVDEPCMLDHVRVESLQPGEEGLTEFVYPQQMLRKENGPTGADQSSPPSSSETLSL